MVTRAAAWQWAEIEACDGYNRLAMMRKWNLPAGVLRAPLARPLFTCHSVLWPALVMSGAGRARTRGGEGRRR